MNGTVVAIYISPTAEAPMQPVQKVMALAGRGLEGDRYAKGEGSFNKKKPWWWKIPLIGLFFKKKNKRQVTLINARFFDGASFTPAESRRNIVVRDAELMDLVGKEFPIGEAECRGTKYCDPCERPSKLSGKKQSFKGEFSDGGGLIVEVTGDGLIEVGSLLIPPPKKY